MSEALRSPTVAQVIASTLAEAGVQRAFGIPGGGTSGLIVELEKVGIGFVLVHTETAAVVMASVCAEHDGVPGVVFTSAGPGAASAVNGLAHAKLDRAAVLVFTDRLPDVANRSGYHQFLDHRALYSGVVKESMTLTETDARRTLHHAIRVAQDAVPGPVHLDLTKAVSEAISEEPPRALPDRPRHLPTIPPDVRQRVAAARRPLLLAGLDARALQPGTLESLAEGLGAPVLTTYKGKGAIDETSRWSAGLLTGGLPERSLLEACDLVISVGLDDVELFWTLPSPAADRIALGTYEQPPGALEPPVSALVGDIDALVRELAVAATRTGWDADAASRHRRDVEAALAAARSAGEGVHPWLLAEALSELCSEDADLAVDAGAHMLPVAQAWRTRRPGGFLISNGLATMGFGLPAANARSAETDRHIVCCTGDGGLLMTAGELATSVRIARHLTIVVFDDRSLSLIKVKQVGAQLGRGVDFAAPDWVQVAAGFDIAATAVTDIASLRAAVVAARGRADVSMIVVRIDPTAYPDILGVLRG